jgi:hypothetical protein
MVGTALRAFAYPTTEGAENESLTTASLNDALSAGRLGGGLDSSAAAALKPAQGSQVGLHGREAAT